MGKHLEVEIQNLKERIVSLGTIVEEVVYDAAKAVNNKDISLAQMVINKDDLVDKREVEIEEECLKILALHQPVAIDLRFIIAVLKINNDLERIADLASGMAARSIELSKLNSDHFILDLHKMITTTKEMLKQSLDSLVEMNADIARKVFTADDIVDDIYRKNYKIGHAKIQEEPSKAEEIILMLSISRNIERIADLATNVAEDVIYMVEGDIVRHKEQVLMRVI